MSILSSTENDENCGHLIGKQSFRHLEKPPIYRCRVRFANDSSSIDYETIFGDLSPLMEHMQKTFLAPGSEAFVRIFDGLIVPT
jgi:hypothetical protein